MAIDEATLRELHEWWDESKVRACIRQVLLERDMDGLSMLGVLLGLGQHADEFDRIAREELAALTDEEARHWWGGPCNCHGLLN